MEVFQLIGKILQSMGVKTNENLNENKFNWKNIGILIMLILLDLFAAFYFLFEADSIVEYSNSAYTTTTILINTISLFEMSRYVSGLIGHVNNLVKKRK